MSHSAYSLFERTEEASSGFGRSGYGIGQTVKCTLVCREELAWIFHLLITITSCKKNRLALLGKGVKRQINVIV